MKCHTETAGPFVFEHPAVKVEGCTSCHSPHGSQNARLLAKSNVNTLCLQCHTVNDNFSAPEIPSFHNQAVQYQACTICHTQIHGSNASAVLLQMKAIIMTKSLSTNYAAAQWTEEPWRHEDGQPGGSYSPVHRPELPYRGAQNATPLPRPLLLTRKRSMATPFTRALIWVDISPTIPAARQCGTRLSICKAALAF